MLEWMNIDVDDYYNSSYVDKLSKLIGNINMLEESKKDKECYMIDLIYGEEMYNRIGSLSSCNICSYMHYCGSIMDRVR